MTNTLEVNALSVFSGSSSLVGPISFSARAGDTVVVMGESGAGKSLLVQAILGTLPISLRSQGMVEVNGIRIDTLSQKRRSAMWGREISTLPQEPWRALDPLMKSIQQTSESYRFVAGMSHKQAYKEALETFALLGLRGAEELFPGVLSGGMAQRVVFAAATAGNAPILLADEPTKGLDALLDDKVVNLLAEVPRNGGTLFVITHEVSVARRLGGRVVVLRDGVAVEQGEISMVLSSPAHKYTRRLLAADPQHWPESATCSVGKTILTASNLAITRGGKKLLHRFNLKLKEGERVALIGPSGIGKTTLLDVLAELLPPTGGAVRHGAGLSPSAVQKLYQDPPAAFPARIPLRHTMQDVARLHKTAWLHVKEILDQLAVDQSLLDRNPDAVSGGELQRISLARALVVRPKVLLADEPTSRLDPITQRETLLILEHIAIAKRIAVILVTHDLNLADKWADRVIDLTSYLPS